MAKGENRESEKGMSHAKGSHGSETVHNIEHVGSHGGEGVRFKMPKEVTDHSCVRELKE